jgi:hypothetical protein
LETVAVHAGLLFTAHLSRIVNNNTGSVVMDGDVVEGWAVDKKNERLADVSAP